MNAATVTPGAPVAWRCHNGDKWSLWRGMHELNHYDAAGNVVEGPDPAWTMQYAYAGYAESRTDGAA